MERRVACHQRAAVELLVRRSEPIAWNSSWPVGNRFDWIRWCLPRDRHSDRTRIAGDREIDIRIVLALLETERSEKVVNMVIPETGSLLKSVKRHSQLADLRFVRLNTLRQSHIDVTVNFGIQEGGDNIHLFEFPVVDNSEG